MGPKDVVKRAWTEAGLYRSGDPKLLAFLRRLDEHPLECWPDLVAECRSRYAEYKQLIAAPLWATGDKGLRLDMLAMADTAREDEVALLHRVVEAADPRHDEAELRAIAQLDHGELLGKIAGKRGISSKLRREVVERRARLGASVRDRVKLNVDLPEEGIARGTEGEIVAVRREKELRFVVAFAGAIPHPGVRVVLPATRVDLLQRAERHGAKAHKRKSKR